VNRFSDEPTLHSHKPPGGHRGADKERGKAEPPHSGGPGTPSRESHEREAARARGPSASGPEGLCAPDVPGLNPELIYTMVAESVRDYAIFLMDTDGVIRCWGEGARLMKWWSKQQAEGSHLRFLYPDGGSEDGTAEEHLREAVETGEYTGEGHRVRSDGSTFWAYVTLTALRGDDGKIVGFTKVTRDFSARRAVEAALMRDRHVTPESHQMLEEANRLRRVMATLSHELRTPLSAITNSIALLERQTELGAPERAHVERLQRNSRHLLSIIDDVLEMSRAEAGTLPMSQAVRRIGPAIDEALADVETQASARGVVVANHVSGGAADLPYWGDEGRVRQILVNLLTNAIKFTDPEGRITISAGTGESVTAVTLPGAGPWIYVRVEDTGRGIAPDRLESIFEPFQQSEPGDEHHGTGLGLSISRQLARAMGGDVAAQSQGVGSQFTLWLPISPSEPIPR
jgi:PAS domain S-box-containing protein